VDMASVRTHLNQLYFGRQNPLRALGEEAGRIENNEGVMVVRCNVGDPTGPTLRAANLLMSRYYRERPEGTGYADHTGEESYKALAAQYLEKMDRLPKGILDASKLACVPGGTGGLNTALSLIGRGYESKPLPVLVTNPYYPPWEPISERNNFQMRRFDLRPQDDYLLNGDLIREQLQDINPSAPAALLYHYPHNPTGKTLTAQDARTVAQTLNGLIAEYPNLFLIQEDLYLATVRSDLGVYTPMQHLSLDALQRTILVLSPSKMGHGQDRGAIVATPNPDIALTLRGSTSFAYLGMSTVSLIGTTRTLQNLVGGINPQTESKKNNHRYVTADYYQERMQAVGQGFLDLENILGLTILDKGIPEGTYYLWPKFEFLKGMRIPVELQDSGSLSSDIHDSFPIAIESGRDIKHVFARAHRIGFLPVMITPGEFFLDKNDEMRMRLAAVGRDLGVMHEVANTILGVTEVLLRHNSNNVSGGFDVRRRSLAELKEQFPPVRTSTYTVKFPGQKRAKDATPI